MAKGLGASLVPGEAGPKGPADSTQVGKLDPNGPPPVPVVLSDAGEVERIGRYEVTGVLGRGGMGVVYEVADREARQLLALKTIETRFLALSESNADGRFRHEITVLERLSHPGIVRLFDSGIAHHPLGYDLAFFVMERLDGETLDREIKSAKPFGLADALGIVRQLGEALAYLEENGVLHRDIKPANVFREIGGRVVLMDFGLARSAEFTRLTLAGQIVGTCAYMSPERLCGKSFEISADVYAVGVVLYQLVSGHQPFTGTTATEMLESIKRGLPIDPAISEMSPDGALESLLRAMLAYKPEDRLKPAELVAQVDLFFEGLLPDPDDTTRGGAKRIRAQGLAPEGSIPNARNMASASNSYPRERDPAREVSPIPLRETKGPMFRPPLDPTRAQLDAAGPAYRDSSARALEAPVARGPTWYFVGLLLAIATSFAFLIGIGLGRVTAKPEPVVVTQREIVEIPATRPPQPATTPAPRVSDAELPSALKAKPEEAAPTPRKPDSFDSPAEAFAYAERLTRRARNLIEKERYAEAIPILENARILNPAEANVCRLLGDAYAGNNEPEHAAVQYKTYLALRPSAEDAPLVKKKLRSVAAP